MLKRQLFIQDAGKEIRRHEDVSGTLVNYLERSFQNQFLESSTQYSVYEAVESQRHRLQKSRIVSVA